MKRYILDAFDGNLNEDEAEDISKKALRKWVMKRKAII